MKCGPVCSFLVYTATIAVTALRANPASVATNCTSDLDCSLLGDCVRGVCECDAGFRGRHCQLPDFLPANADGGLNDWDHPSWGGHVIFADGKYHMFASYLMHQCPLQTYATNSAILRAESDSPGGPFVYKETVLPAFHHGATIVRHVDGTFLLFADGKDMPACTVQRCDGTVGETETSSSPQTKLDDPYAYGHGPTDVVVVASAQTVYGPWSTSVVMETDLSRGPAAWSCNTTNPAPFVLKNGTVALGFRSNACKPSVPCASKKKNKCDFVGMAMSTGGGWKGPYARPASDIRALRGNADGFFWQNKRGFLALHNSKEVCGVSPTNAATCGALAFSKDMVHWTLSKVPFYRSRIKWEDGTSERLVLRQRPKILFSEDGAPRYLYNGVQRSGSTNVQTIAVPFNVPENNPEATVAMPDSTGNARYLAYLVEAVMVMTIMAYIWCNRGLISTGHVFMPVSQEES